MAKAGWSQIDSTPPLGLPMGGRGPRFSPGTEILDPLVAQAVVLEDGSGERTLWLSIDMIGMAWPQTSGFRQELSAMTGIAFRGHRHQLLSHPQWPHVGVRGLRDDEAKPADLTAYEDDLIQALCEDVDRRCAETPGRIRPRLSRIIGHRYQSSPARCRGCHGDGTQS